MLARRFFYVSLGILALSIAYHLGSRSVEAQGGTNTVASSYSITTANVVALTHNGDLWFTQGASDPGNPNGYPWTFGGNIFSGTTAVAPVKPQDTSSAKSGTLSSPRPNPFNPSTQIAFTLDVAAPVELRIYDSAGALVRTLVDRPQTAGNHAVEWNGADDSGRPVASGTYFYQLRVNGAAVGSRKAVVLR
ncbi:MAG: FlgD immunoglobulin-like domain containing protein [bacterium]